MAVEVEFEVSTDKAFHNPGIYLPEGVRVSLEAAVPLTRESMLPFMWVKHDDGDFAAVERAFERHPAVRDVHVVEEAGTEALFQLDWNAKGEGIFELIRETDGILLEGAGHDGRWTFIVRFRSNEDVSRFQKLCNGNDLAITVNRVSRHASRDADFFAGLTPQQREAVLLAHRLGYFSVPRRCSLVDVAEQLGITDQAASERIRRGLQSLLHRGTSAES